MRQLFLTFGLALLGSVLFAHHNSRGAANKSDLNIKMWDNSSFIITIDNEFTERTRSFNLQNIEPGYHFVKIVKKRKNHHGYGGFVQTIYKGNIKVPARKKVFVKVEGKNRLSFKFFKKRNRNNGHGGYNNNGHYDEWDSGCDAGNYGDDFGNNNGNHYYGPTAMSQQDFNRLVNKVLITESFRLQAKQLY